MNIGIPKESLAGETRVACTPATVAQLQKLGFAVVVERGAGQGASLADAAYEAAGATLADTATVWQCPLLYKVNAPNAAEIARLTAGQTLVSFLWPAQNPELVKELAAKKVNVLAMDMVPRISRAQALDALSSMANISGYRAVIEAANAFGRFFTGQITAAGKVPPAQVLVIGAGVAGLAAIGTANALGAIVKAFDTRLEVAEQIESMGGKFLKLDFPQEAGGSSAVFFMRLFDGCFPGNSCPRERHDVEMQQGVANPGEQAKEDHRCRVTQPTCTDGEHNQCHGQHRSHGGQ